MPTAVPGAPAPGKDGRASSSSCTVSWNWDGVFVPPLSLVTTFTTLSVAPMSSLVIVQVLACPTVTLIAPLASQSPENVAA